VQWDVPAGITTYSGFVSAGGTASDNCTGAIAISFSDATTPGTCANKFTVTRTYTATDVCGNTATSNQTITVNDNVAPTITAPSGTTVTCSGDVPAGITTYSGFVSAGGTASDNCTGAIAISFSDATTPGTCANKFTVTRTYKATDVCGNTATSNQTITVNDNVAPTITAHRVQQLRAVAMYRQVSQPTQVLYQQEEQQVIIVQEQLRSASVMRPHREHVPISLQ
jgi:hypothetical protein